MTSPSLRDRKRLVWVSLSVFFLFCLLIVQFYKIQIVQGEKWTQIANKQHKHVLIEPFKRGVFYSHVGIKKGHPAAQQPFVIDVPKFHLFVDPDSIPNAHKAEVATTLSTSLHIPQKWVEAEIKKTSRSRKIAAWLEKETQEKVLEWWTPFARSKKIAKNALYFVQDYRRSYPFGSLLGQVLHTVREDKDPLTHQSIPTGGLELVFNRVLQGKEGKRVLLRSLRHALGYGKVTQPSEDGADVYLTINHYLQQIAEEEIAKAVEEAHAKGGWAILMDPFTGEIFALAQYPFFDPTSYNKFFNDPVLREHTKVKALSDPFEPGSTMKPLTLAIALMANKELKAQGKKPLFSPSEKIPCAIGSVPGRSKPMKDLHTHAYLNMQLAVQKSSDVYMAKLMQRIMESFGAEWYRSKLHDVFGLGVKTALELPGESAGLVPTPGKKHASGALEWSGPTPYSLAIGYNILVNSVQMLRCYAMLANGGYEVTPTLVRKIVKTSLDAPPEILLDNAASREVKTCTRLIDADIVKEIAFAMKFVTKPGGTAPRGDIEKYSEAGKTGTSEKVTGGSYSKKNHISNFIGFAPASEPRLVLMVVIDEPEFKFIPGVGKNQHGGVCCAPAFRNIATRALEYLGVTPDDPDHTDWKKETHALKELYLSWNR